MNLLPENPTPEKCLSYALNVVEGRLEEEYEDIILQDPIVTLSYIRAVIKEPWKKAEELSLRKDAITATSYAIFVLKGRFKEAEDVIAENPNAACLYARVVIKGRWKKAETHKMKSSIWWDIYKYYAGIKDDKNIFTS